MFMMYFIMRLVFSLIENFGIDHALLFLCVKGYIGYLYCELLLMNYYF